MRFMMLVKANKDSEAGVMPDKTLLTEVIDTKLKRPGNQFELTEGIARRIGLDGVQRIEWRFASPPSG